MRGHSFNQTSFTFMDVQVASDPVTYSVPEIETGPPQAGPGQRVQHETLRPAGKHRPGNRYVPLATTKLTIYNLLFI